MSDERLLELLKLALYARLGAFTATQANNWGGIIVALAELADQRGLDVVDYRDAINDAIRGENRD